MKKILLVFIFSQFFCLGFTQNTLSDLNVNKKFLTKKKLADEAYDKDYYEQSATMYTKLLKSFPVLEEDDDFLFHLAKSEWYTKDYINASKHFETAYSLQKDQEALSLFYAAKCKLILGDDRSNELFLAFIDKFGSNTKYKDYLLLAKNQLGFFTYIISDNQEDIPVFKLALPGEQKTSFSPFYVSDSTIYFTMGEQVTVKHVVDLPSGKLKVEEKYVNDMYRAMLYDGQLVNVANLEVENLPTKDNFMAGSVSADGSKLFFTQCRVNDCQIYSSNKIKKHEWSEAALLNKEINKPNTVSKNPYSSKLSNGNEVLFFSSNRNKSKSGWDIFYVLIDANGKFGDVMSLPNDINTVMDEESPYYDPLSRTLFFASDGHAGLGGKDIFSVTLKDFRSNSPVLNMGKDVNSVKDENHFRLNRDGKTGLVVSNRLSNNNLDQVLYFKYLENFDFRKIANSYSVKKYWIIQDDKSSWIYIKDKNVALEGKSNGKDGDVFYLVNSDEEIVDVANLMKGTFSFKDVISSEKLKIVSENSNNSVSMSIRSNNEVTKIDEVVIVPEKSIRDFQYKKLSTSASFAKMTFDEASTKFLLEALQQDSAFIIYTDYDVDRHFYLLDEQGRFYAFSEKNNQNNQEIRTGEIPSKFLLNRKISDLATVYVTTLSGKVIKKFTYREQPQCFEFEENKYEESEVLMSFDENNRPVFESYLSDFQLKSSLGKKGQVKLIDLTDSLTIVADTDEKGEFVFRRLQASKKYLLIIDAEDQGLLDHFVFENNEGKEVLAIHKEETPRYFTYKKLTTEEKKKFGFDKPMDESSFASFLDVENKESDPLIDVLEIKNQKNHLQFHAVHAGVNIKGKALAGTKVFLFDTDEKIVTILIADNNGEFEFRNIPIDKSYYLEIQASEGEFITFDVYDGVYKIDVKNTLEIFAYRKIQSDVNKELISHFPDESHFDFDLYAIQSKASKNLEKTNSSAEKPVIATKTEEVNTEQIDLLSIVEEYVRFIHSEEEVREFIVKYSGKSQTGITIQIQILSRYDSNLKYEKAKIEKDLGITSHYKGNGLFVIEEFLSLDKANNIRSKLLESGLKINPIFVIYQDGKRKYSLIAN